MNPSPESLWYYADAANQPVGPLTMDVLQRLAGVGVISPETHVLEMGGIEWKKFGSIVPPPACAETKPASADIPLASATVPAKENAADGLISHGKNAEGFFQNCRRRLKALAVIAKDKSNHYRTKAKELFDAYKHGLEAQADKRADKVVPEPGEPPTEKRQPTTKKAVQGGAVLVLLVIAITLWHYSPPLLYLAVFLGTWYAVSRFGQRAKQSKVVCIGGGFVLGLVALVLVVKLSGGGKESKTIPPGKKAISVEGKRTFALTAEQFRTAFNKKQSRQQIESFKPTRTIKGDPQLSYFFSDQSILNIELEPETRRMRVLTCTFAKNPPEKSHEPYILATTIISTLSPDATSSETWNLLNRLTKDADGADEVKPKNDVLRNLNVCMVSLGKDDSGSPLIGLIFDPRPAEASLEWFEKAAAQGNAVAQFTLGTMYAGGRGVGKDEAKAVEWYQKAAAQGHATAHFVLGAMYENGRGVEKDEAKAVEWYQKGAAQGNAESQFALGTFYADGQGVPKDEAEAVEWFEKAAAQGNADAQFYLGTMYGDGKGVPQNDVRAYAWFNLAAAQNHKPATVSRATLAARMALAQKAEAQKLSAELFKKMPKK